VSHTRVYGSEKKLRESRHSILLFLQTHASLILHRHQFTGTMMALDMHLSKYNFKRKVKEMEQGLTYLFLILTLPLKSCHCVILSESLTRYVSSSVKFKNFVTSKFSPSYEILLLYSAKVIVK
jgi:hypothetical protein